MPEEQNMLLPETYSDAYANTRAKCVFLSNNYACSYTFIASLIKTNQLLTINQSFIFHLM